MAYRYGGLTWLAVQTAGRWRRSKWKGNVDKFADELWTVMSRLRDDTPDQVEVVNPGGGVTLEEVQNLIDSIDLLSPDHEHEPDHTHEEGDDFIRAGSETTEWVRGAFPGKITGHTGGDIYTVLLHPYGFLDILNPDGSTDEAAPVTEEAQVQQLQIATGEVIPNDTWVIVMRLIQYKVSVTAVIDNASGQVISQFKSYEELQKAHYMQCPIWL